MGVDGPVGYLVPAGNIAIQLDGRCHGRSRSSHRADDGDQGSSGTGGGEAKEEERSLSMEDLRRKYSWWPNGGGKEEQPVPLIDVEAGEGDGAALHGIKSTKL